MIKVLLVCLTTCFMLANTADFAATVSCMKCSINCQFNKCVRITADGYDNQFCGTSECNLNKSYPELFFKCDYDVSGKKCSTGVCFQPPAHGCADTTSCTNSYYLNTACETCTSIAGCTQCLVTRTNSTGIQLGSESCLGNSCNDVQTVNRNIAACANSLDPFGNPCTCCYNVTAVVDKRVGVCTASNALYSGAGFNTYAQSKTSESSLIMSLMLVLSMITLMLAY